MGFPKKKTYGVYKTVTCPFCSRQATQKNEQGIEVCYQHIKQAVEEIKCTCGSWLEPRGGKFGRYFNCINCGNINYEKGMQIKEITLKKTESVVKSVEKKKVVAPIAARVIPREREERKETIITSRDVDYFD